MLDVILLETYLFLGILLFLRKNKLKNKKKLGHIYRSITLLNHV